MARFQSWLLSWSQTLGRIREGVQPSNSLDVLIEQERELARVEEERQRDLGTQAAAVAAANLLIIAAALAAAQAVAVSGAAKVIGIGSLFLLGTSVAAGLGARAGAGPQPSLYTAEQSRVKEADRLFSQLGKEAGSIELRERVLELWRARRELARRQYAIKEQNLRRSMWLFLVGFGGLTAVALTAATP